MQSERVLVVVPVSGGCRVVEFARWPNRLLTRIGPRKPGGHVPVQMVDGVRVFGVGLVSVLPAKICAFFWSQAALRALTAGLLVVSATLVVTPWSSGTWFGTCVHGLKLSAGGAPLTKSVLMGDATRSNWFMGGRPRICSIVRVMLTCV